MNLLTTLHSFNDALALYLTIPLIFFIGIYFTVTLRAIQITCLPMALRQLLSREDSSEGCCCITPAR